MKKILLRYGFRIARLYWRIVQPRTLGVHAIVLDQDRRVLLVRNSYRSGWFFPGGGVRRAESAYEALLRELEEEVNITCRELPGLYSGPFYHILDHRHDHVLVFEVKEWDQSGNTSRSAEIEEMAFFDHTDLPEDTGPGTRRRIEEYFSGVKGGPLW